MDKIQRLLEMRGLRQADLSRATGIRESRFSQLSRDDGKLRLPEALRVARALGVTVDYLADPELDEPIEPNTSPTWVAIREIVGELGEQEALKRLLRPPGPIFDVPSVQARENPPTTTTRHESKGRAG